MWLTILICLWFALLIFVIIREVSESRTNVVPRLSVVQIRRDYMADVLTYRVSAPVSVSKDVVNRLLTLSVNGKDEGIATLPGNATELSVFSVPQNAEVVLTLVDVDDAGNKSEAATLSFVAVDTIPPAAPGGLGVTLVGETHVEPETPADPVEPEVVDEPVVDEATDSTEG